MKVNIKKLTNGAIIPKYALDGDAGLDITALTMEEEGSNLVYRTGLAFEIPKGFVGLIFPRSSISKKDLVLCNSVGVIDENFRGEVLFKFKKLKEDGNFYNVGDRIGQIIILPYPKIEFVEAEELSETNRGSGGYGSTGA